MYFNTNCLWLFQVRFGSRITTVFQQTVKAPGQGRLFIRTTPEEAGVRILNIYEKIKEDRSKIRITRYSFRFDLFAGDAINEDGDDSGRGDDNNGDGYNGNHGDGISTEFPPAVFSANIGGTKINEPVELLSSFENGSISQRLPVSSIAEGREMNSRFHRTALWLHICLRKIAKVTLQPGVHNYRQMMPMSSNSTGHRMVPVSHFWPTAQPMVALSCIPILPKVATILRFPVRTLKNAMFYSLNGYP